jgi:hypothetical protein
MRTTKKSERYIIEHKQREIIVEVFNDGQMTVEPLNNPYKRQGFVFEGSTPKMVEIIGEMLIEASKLYLNKD